MPSVAIVNETPPSREMPFLTEWVALWAPHLALALVTGSTSVRKQIAARCIPLLVRIVGGTTRRYDATFAFAFLLNEVQAICTRPCAIGEYFDSYAPETETLSDRALWATFEVSIDSVPLRYFVPREAMIQSHSFILSQIAKQASLQKLMKPSCSSNHLANAIAKNIPKDVLETSLTHSSHLIRLVAFASIEAIVPTYYSEDAPPMELLEKEITFWRRALPYAFKSDSKEYNKELLLILSSLLNRLSDVESACHDNAKAFLALSTGIGETYDGAADYLPTLISFVCDFLITEVIVQQGAYLGTVADKEGFVLALFQCILSFASQDKADSVTATTRKKSGGPCRKSPRAIEVTTMRHILAFMLTDEPMSSVFSLLHSMWDSTRASAFAGLCHLVDQAHIRGYRFPFRFSSNDSVRCIQARSIYLASSPRQREADTGSKILAFIGTLYETEDERCLYSENLLTLLSERLDIMTTVLGVMDSVTPGAALLDDGTKMPMAHGLMMALRLTVENQSIMLGKNNAFYDKFVTVCCRALQLSLSVVADLKDHSSLNEEERSNKEGTAYIAVKSHSTNAPLNVNTGAIGANAGFSSIQCANENEALRRFALQRVIVSNHVTPASTTF